MLLGTRSLRRAPTEYAHRIETANPKNVVGDEPCTDPELVSAVEEVLVRLVEGMDDPPYEFRVRVIQSEDINAFALPGGEIFFHSALLEKSESVHEVAAVMGHEVQHVLQRHGMRGIVRSAGLSIGLTVLLGLGVRRLSTGSP